CVTLVYAPVGVPWVDEAMRRLAEANDLVFGTDVIPLPTATPFVNDPLWCETAGRGERLCALDGLPERAQAWQRGDLTDLCAPCPLVWDNATFSDVFLTWPNYTQHGVLFHSAYMTLLGDRLGRDVAPESGYTLFYPGSVHFFSALSSAFAFRRAPEPALVLSAKAAEPGRVRMEVNVRDFPTTRSRFYGFDLTAFEGGLFFFMAPASPFLLLLLAVVGEREVGHAAHLRMLGVGADAHLLSWAAAAGALSAVSAAAVVLTARLARLPLFLAAASPLTFLLFFLAGAAMSAAALALAAMVQTVKRAQTAGLVVVLVGLLAQAVACSAGGLLLRLLFIDEV
ncbi:unnamed protein product, partial [Phaeothamnion confervicola]